MKEPQKQNRNQTAQRHAAAVVFGHVKTAFSCKTHSDPRFPEYFHNEMVFHSASLLFLPSHGSVQKKRKNN